MKFAALLFVSAAILLSPNASALSELHKKHGCISCHADEKKLIGPAYKDVAERFSKDWKTKEGMTITAEAAPKYLFEKIRKGGAGNWGVLPMTANSSASDQEVAAMVASIMELAKTPAKKK
jgi:cytochrome c